MSGFIGLAVGLLVLVVLFASLKILREYVG